MRLSWKLPVEHLSASSMSLFLTCPEQWRRKHILKESEKNFGSRFIGNVDHRVNAEIFREKMNNRDFNIEEIYRSEWNEALEKDGEPDWQDDDPTKMFERGVRMAKAYQEQVGKDIIPVAIESRFEFVLPDVPVPIIGYIDVAESALIRERKTSAVKQTTPKPAWRFQGLIYQLATGLPVTWDVVTRQATCQIYTAKDYPDLLLPVGDVQKTKSLISDVVRRLNDCYQRFGKDEPWPTTGIFHSFQCNYCPAGPKHRSDCVAWSS